MKKTENILIRLTESEKNEIKKKAEESKMTLSEYARKMLINGKVISISAEEKRTISGVAINFNQMIRKFNSLNIKPLGLEQQLEELIKELKDAYRKHS